MPLRIRLRRVGRKKQPSYRLVVTDSEVRRDGPYLDEVGFYNPRTQPAELRLDLAKVEVWVGKGATLSDTAASLVRKARKGGDAKVGYRAPEAEAGIEAEAKPAPKETAESAAPAVEATAAAEPETPAAGEAPAPEAAE